MTNQSLVCQVALYLRGDDLNPSHITDVLGILPTEAQRKGESRVTSTKTHFKTRTGLWAFIDKGESMDITAFLDDLSAKIGGKLVAEIDGVQDAYVDIFVAQDSDEDGGGTYALELSQKSILILNQLGLPIRFTVAIVKE